jgi:hypothetical protein
MCPGQDPQGKTLIYFSPSLLRWPYRRLKCTIKPKDLPKKINQQQPEVFQQKQQQQHRQIPASPSLHSDEVTASQHHQHQRRTDRPQRQAALGVQDAVGRAKADINDDEIATVIVAPRNGKNALDINTTTANHIAPKIPEPSSEELAYQSMSAEESQALSVLLGGMGAARDSKAGAPAARATTAGGTPVLMKTERRDTAPKNLAAIPPIQQQQQQQQQELANMFDPSMLKSMEIAMQMHFVAEQQRQQQAASAAMAAFAAATASAPPPSGQAQQQQQQIYAAVMQAMSALSAPQDPSAAMLARSMIENFSANAGSMQQYMSSYYHPQQAAAVAANGGWNGSNSAPAPAPAPAANPVGLPSTTGGNCS